MFVTRMAGRRSTRSSSPPKRIAPSTSTPLARLCEAGLAELEIHLHHDNDTSEGLRSTLRGFADCLAREHGLLGRRTDGRPAYGFIHGNWALDNARPDGKYCGVNDELSVLRETGCYADFTQPAAPDVSQTRTVNSLYYAVDDPRKPRSHERGLRGRGGPAATARRAADRPGTVVARLGSADRSASFPVSTSPRSMRRAAIPHRCAVSGCG